MLELIANICSFAAVITGILGNTWNAKKKGISKLTATGRIALVVGLISFAVTIIIHFKTQNELDLQQDNRKKVLLIAYKEIDITIKEMNYPLATLYIDLCEKKGNECQHENRSKITIEELNALTEKQFLSQLDSFDIRLCPAGMFPKKSWQKIFGESAEFAKQQLTDTSIKFGTYFDTEFLLAIESILDDPFLQYAMSINNYAQDFHNGGGFFGTVPSHFLIASPEAQQRLVDYIRKLNSLTNLVKSRMEDK